MEFETVEELEEWLKTQPQEVSAAIATRAALRVWPIILADEFWKDGDKAHGQQETLALLTGWAMMTSWVAVSMPTPEVKAAARFASRSAFSASRSASSVAFISAADAAARSAYSVAFSDVDASAHSASTAVRSASSAAAAAYMRDQSASSASSAVARSAVFGDAGFNLVVMLGRTLWGDTVTPVKLRLEGLGPNLLDTDSRFDFFARWYRGMDGGQQLPVALLHRIATEIPPETWESGIDAVAPEIARIERSYRTSVTPRLKRRDDGLFDVEDDVDVDQEPLEFAKGQVEIALSAALSNPGNGLGEKSSETQLIQFALTRFSHNPSVVATSFWNACMSLNRNIGDVYPDDPALLGLKNSLYTSVEEMCEQSDVIRERIAKLAALEPRRLPTPQEREELAKAPEVVADAMTAKAQEQFQDAIDNVVKTEKPSRVWRARLVEWITTLGQGIDKGQKVEKRANWLLKLAGRISGWFFDDDDSEE